MTLNGFGPVYCIIRRNQRELQLRSYRCRKQQCGVFCVSVWCFLVINVCNYGEHYETPCTLTWFIRRCGLIYYYLVLVSVYVWHWSESDWFRPVPHIYSNKDQIITYAATPPNEPRQCILTHFNNCIFTDAQTVCSLRIVFFTSKHVGAF
jgi:hypothetical protein